MQTIHLNLKILSDNSLLESTRDLAAKEREITLSILHHLREVERRRLFAVLGYSSLHEYCRQDLHWSEGSAHRRISSMRLLKELPELEKKLETGILNLSLLSQAQSFLRREPTKTLEEKRECLTALEGKSTREAERVLLKRASQPEKHLPEKIRAISETHAQVTFTADQTLIDEIRELQGLLAHTHPGMSIEDVIRHAVNDSLKRLKPKAPKSPPAPESAPELKKETRRDSAYVPAEIKRAVWHRDRGECSYIHTKSGRKCASRYALEYDHFQPRRLGGPTTVQNLRLRCRTHNQLAAIQTYGQNQMARFVPGLE